MYKNYSESTPLPTPIFLSTASIAMSHPVVVSHASKINTTVVVLAVDIFDYAKPLPSFLILWEREMSEWVSWECCWCKLVRLALLWRIIAKNLNPALFTQTQVNNLICTHTFALPCSAFSLPPSTFSPSKQHSLRQSCEHIAVFFVSFLRERYSLQLYFWEWRNSSL